MIKWFYKHFDATREIIELLTRHRQLTIEMARREITDRYARQLFGPIWAVVHPLIMIGIYVFIFSFVFKTKINAIAGDSNFDYTTYILAGLIPWLATQESLNKCCISISSNVSLVKQVIFPIEVLPVKSVLATFASAVIMFALLVIYILSTTFRLPVMFALLPVVFFFQLIFLLGLGYVLSAAGAYFRDIKDFVQVFSIAGIYAMPTFYLPDAIPAAFRPLLYFNPFSYMTWCYQDVICFGRFAHPWAWPVFIFLSMFSFYAGYRIFRKAKIMFGSVL